MPNRIWSEELQKWVMVDEARFALQTKVVDVKREEQKVLALKADESKVS